MNGEITVAHMYSCDALQAGQKTQGRVQLLIPKEGGVMAVDNLVIPKSAAHIKEAHQLLNFLLTAEVTKSRVSGTFAGPILMGIREQLSQDLQNNKLLFPDEKDLAKFESLRDLGDASALYDRAWTELKADAG